MLGTNTVGFKSKGSNISKQKALINNEGWRHIISWLSVFLICLILFPLLLMSIYNSIFYLSKNN